MSKIPRRRPEAATLPEASYVRGAVRQAEPAQPANNERRQKPDVHEPLSQDALQEVAAKIIAALGKVRNGETLDEDTTLKITYLLICAPGMLDYELDGKSIHTAIGEKGSAAMEQLATLKKLVERERGGDAQEMVR